MKRFYTAESVTEGHPDKLCDLIADSILDACLKEDENSKVACEVLATKGNIIVAGEITSRYEPQVFEIVRKVLESAGYEADGIHMDALIHKQSPDIAGAVERSRERRTGTVSVQSGLANGAGDQGIMVGYACDDTPQLMPMPVVLANRIVRELSASRRSGYIMGILPDGKAYDDEVPFQSIRDYLGHDYEEMTQQYVDFMPKKISAANQEFFKKGENSLASGIKKCKRGK